MLRIPDDLAFGIQEDIQLNPNDKKKPFNELLDNSLFLHMTAYTFAELVSNQKVGRAKTSMASLLSMTNNEFQDWQEGPQGMANYIFDKDEFAGYVDAFFQILSEAYMVEIIQALSDENYIPETTIDDDLKEKMKLLEFKLEDISDESKMKKLLRSYFVETENKETGKKTKDFEEKLVDNSGDLMDAFDKGREIIYEDLRKFVRLVGDKTIRFDTDDYLDYIFKEEHNVSLDVHYGGRNRKETKLIGLAREDKAIAINEKDKLPIFNATLLNNESIELEGWFGKKNYDSISDVYQEVSKMSFDGLEKHLEDNLISDNPSRLKDLIYTFITPDMGRLDVGKLAIHIRKTDKTEKRFITDWRKQQGQMAESNKEAQNLEAFLELYFDAFEVIDDFDSKILPKLYDKKSESKYLEADIAEMFGDEEDTDEDEIDVESLRQIQADRKKLEEEGGNIGDITEGDSKEKESPTQAEEELLGKLKELRQSALAHIQKIIDVKEEGIYEMWIDHAGDDIATVVGRLFEKNMETVIMDDKGHFSSHANFNENTAQQYYVSQSGNTLEQIVWGVLEFEPTYYIDTKEFNISRPTGQSITGKKKDEYDRIRRPLASMPKEEEAQKLLKLKLGYNRLKALVN